MLCSGCGVTVPQGATYCFGCGERLMEAGNEPLLEQSTDKLTRIGKSEPPVSDVAGSDAVENGVPVAVEPSALPVSEEPGGEFRWTEFSATPPMEPAYVDASQANYTRPAFAGPVRPVYTPVSYAVPPHPGLPRAMPARGRQSRHRGLWFLFSIALCFLVVLLIAGVVFSYFYAFMGQVNKATPLTATSRAASGPGADQIYRQVMSQSPLYSESLQVPSPAGWYDYSAGSGQCKIQPDGLHVMITQVNRIFYCFSRHGAFNDFAFQVDVSILSGASSGLVIRRSVDTSSYYYFSISPDGSYYIRIRANNTWGSLLDSGTSNDLIPGYHNLNNLTVIAQGRDLYFYVNKHFLTTVEDSTYAYGLLGLAANESSANADVVYSNAKIWEL